jgi:hypothetical protein
MTEQKDSKKTFEIRPIELEPGIYDFTIPIRNYIEKEIPFSDEEINVLRTFEENYSFEEDINNRGRNVILAELNDASKHFNFEEAKKAVKEGLVLAQKINPDIKLREFPVIFLFNPISRGPKALKGQGCAFNIKSFVGSRHSNGDQYKEIVSGIAHEATHVFLTQLGKHPLPFSIKKDHFDKGIYDFLWLEGLTTYIEPTHYPHHDLIIKDAEFWIEIINNWVKSKDVNRKESLLKECFQRPSTISWFNDMYPKDRIPNVENLNEYGLDSIFLRLLTEGNGPGYHIGSYIWQKKIEEGNNIKDLVMAGSDEMSKWIKEV